MTNDQLQKLQTALRKPLTCSNKTLADCFESSSAQVNIRDNWLMVTENRLNRAHFWDSTTLSRSNVSKFFYRQYVTKKCCSKNIVQKIWNFSGGSTLWYYSETYRHHVPEFLYTCLSLNQLNMLTIKKSRNKASRMCGKISKMGPI